MFDGAPSFYGVQQYYDIGYGEAHRIFYWAGYKSPPTLKDVTARMRELASTDPTSG